MIPLKSRLVIGTVQSSNSIETCNFASTTNYMDCDVQTLIAHEYIIVALETWTIHNCKDWGLV